MQINGNGRIDPTALGAVRPGAADRGTPQKRTETAATTSERPKQDTVSFSEEGRALASGTAAQSASAAGRAQEVRQRVLLGAYNTAEMAGEVAKRILQRGDL